MDLSKTQSLWRENKNKCWSFICPLCQAPRKLAFRPQPGGARHIFQIALTTFVFTFITWKWFGWKGLVVAVPLWTVFETIYRWRARGVMSCSLCGFDPYLFLIDEKWAKKEIEAHWRKKFEEKGIPYPTNST